MYSDVTPHLWFLKIRHLLHMLIIRHLLRPHVARTVQCLGHNDIIFTLNSLPSPEINKTDRIRKPQGFCLSFLKVLLGNMNVILLIN